MIIRWLPLAILLLPLIAAAVILLFTRRHPRLSATLAIAAVGLGLAASTFLFVDKHDNVGGSDTLFTWMTVGETAPGEGLLPAAPGQKPMQFDFSLQVDKLSLLMLLVVTLVGTLVHIFSLEYMRRDADAAMYYAGLSLFMFSMLGIVLVDNLLMLFIFWELVGVSSYLLISFWFQNPAAADAGKKAFLTNRIGDAGFLIGILMVWSQYGTLEIGVLAAKGQVTTAAGLLLFCGAVGKSAQFPLHVWLPDAMEGPTPVSALIHAATMVAAGVYMLCRLFFVFTPDALYVIGWVGGMTALLAALMAVQQNDLKRILAFSTVSQLGYMVMAVGCAAPAAAMFHLTTHAAFKALLFLGAGAILHRCHHEQDIWKLGGLHRQMPWTARMFVAGSLALAGFPLLSGFFSKDTILAAAYAGHKGLFAVAVGVAVLTALYMMRCVLVVFFGESRSEATKDATDPPSTMLLPLIILTVLSVGLGYIGPWVGQGFNDWWTELSLQWRNQPDYHTHPFINRYAIAGTLAALAGMGLGWWLYGRAEEDRLADRLGRLATVMREKFYFDELYEWLNRWTQEKLAQMADWVDRWVIAGAGVKGLSGATDIAGCLLRLVQSGNLQSYAMWLAIGLLLMLGLFLF